MVHLLLVEDNDADALLIREALRRSPIPVDLVIASDGEQASDLLESAHSFNLIILDLNIPKVDGHRLLKRLRRQDGLPVVVFSSSDGSTDMEKALALGARDYVVKPWGYEEFMRAVQGILERWTSRPDDAAVAATGS
jgi:two-component system, chemotaxis family, response regulator Rcp1